jgi:hypothetical protein
MSEMQGMQIAMVQSTGTACGLCPSYAEHASPSDAQCLSAPIAACHPDFMLGR